MTSQNYKMKEFKIYDSIAHSMIANIDKTAVYFFGKSLIKQWKIHRDIGEFPYPISWWIDSASVADAQFEAYRYLAPIKNHSFLQLGGSGSHVIKALLSGASKGLLLSPSQDELRLAMSLAKFMGVNSNFIPICGIGEKIPLHDESVDLIYGGGCLHHTDISRSIPELYRILKRGGRAAFVDPRLNILYNILMLVTKGRKFLGKEDDLELDRPIDLTEAGTYLRNCTYKYRIYLSGGILRYGLIAMNRLLKIDLINAKLSSKILRVEGKIMNELGIGKLCNIMSIMFEK